MALSTPRIPPVARPPVNASALAALQAWLTGEDFVDADDAAITAELGRRLRAAGLPVDRLEVHVSALHPDLPARVVSWRPNAPVEVYEPAAAGEAPRGQEPARLAIQRGEAVVIPVGASRPAGPVQTLGAAAGAEQVALPLGPMDAPLGALVAATERAGGFAGPELLALADMAPSLGAACELRALRRTELPVLDTHCGRPTAGRVLGRQLRAGRIETLEAAWLRCRPGSHPEADGADPAVQLERLGDFFASLAQVAADHGGLVMSASDDGALAVFCQDDAAAACAAALGAALELVLSEPGAIPPEIALHYGPVSYGGLPGRGSTLVILGPAQPLLNGVLASCAVLGRPILLTAAFAARLRPECARPLLPSDGPHGDFELHVLADDLEAVAAARLLQTNGR